MKIISTGKNLAKELPVPFFAEFFYISLLYAFSHVNGIIERGAYVVMIIQYLFIDNDRIKIIQYNVWRKYLWKHLYETFRNYISTAAKHDYPDYAKQKFETRYDRVSLLRC